MGIQKPNLYLYTCVICQCKQKEDTSRASSKQLLEKEVAHKGLGRDRIGDGYIEMEGHRLERVRVSGESMECRAKEMEGLESMQTGILDSVQPMDPP